MRSRGCEDGYYLGLEKESGLVLLILVRRSGQFEKEKRRGLDDERRQE